MLIEVVTHCWRYSRALAYQLSSLVNHPPRVDVMVQVLWHGDDEPTGNVLEAFAGWERSPLAGEPHSVCDRFVTHSLETLLQRSIGRNEAARKTEADVVWFCDADYYFGEGCLDALAAAHLEDDVLYWPPTCWKHKTHAMGDEYLRRVNPLAPLGCRIDPDDFESVRQRAIGGVQIVTGSTARRRGYCPESKWQIPLPPGSDRFEFGSDVVYRRQFQRIEPVELPNLFRLRQTTSGVVDLLAPERPAA